MYHKQIQWTKAQISSRANVAAGIISATETKVPARPRRVLFLTQHWRRSRRGPIVKFPLLTNL